MAETEDAAALTRIVYRRVYVKDCLRRGVIPNPNYGELVREVAAARRAVLTDTAPAPSGQAKAVTPSVTSLANHTT